MIQNQSFVVTGGKVLSGSLQPQGAKNEALQVICATVLTDQVVILDNVPNILDVKRLIELLRGLGVEVKQLGANRYQFEAKDIDLEYFGSEEYYQTAKKIRGSVMLIGPLLARFKKAYIPKPGGDKIGRRRIDTHLLGFQKLGAKFIYNDKQESYQIDASNLQGQFILMDEISVTGTANLVMAASMARGTTKLYNAACEPYLQQLCKMLVRMGARIEGIGSNLITIHGVQSLGGTEHRILPDMIEIGSFIGMAVMTRSDILIRDARKEDLGIIPMVFERLGVTMEWTPDGLHIPTHDHYSISTFIDGSILTVYDAPWPGFTPDLMSIILVMATQAKGSVLIHQKMFESRLFFVDKLIDMGAQIILCDPHRATIIGLDRSQALRGISMTSPDIRAGVALLIAAMSADGESRIFNIQQIDRGYERIDERLNAIGAEIIRIA